MSPDDHVSPIAGGGIDRVRRIEEASLRAWPALTDTDFDGWRLRFADGYTRRANSITPLGPSRLAIEDKIATCERLYADRDLPAIFRLTPLAPPDLHQRLIERGYQPGDRVDVRARPFGGGTPAMAPRASGRMRSHDLESWLDIFGALGRSPSRHRAAHRAVLLTVPGQRRLVAFWVDERPVACGMAVLADHLLGLFDLVTAPEHRNRGNGSELLRRILAWGARAGAREAYLQVVPENSAAVRIYDRAGFTTVYRYQYLQPG